MDNHLHFTNYETRELRRRRRASAAMPCLQRALPASRQFANHYCRCSGGGRGREGRPGGQWAGRGSQGQGGPRPPRASGGRRGGVMTASLAKALAGKILEAAEGVISSSSRRPRPPRHLQALAGRGRRRRLQVRAPRGSSRAPPQRAARSRSQNGLRTRVGEESSRGAAGTRPAACAGRRGVGGALGGNGGNGGYLFKSIYRPGACGFHNGNDSMRDKRFAHASPAFSEQRRPRLSIFLVR